MLWSLHMQAALCVCVRPGKRGTCCQQNHNKLIDFRALYGVTQEEIQNIQTNKYTLPTTLQRDP